MYNKTVLSNGIKIVSETIPHFRSVTIGVWVGTGSRNEANDIQGVSHFIEHLMFKGTASRSAKDIADTVDAVGGQLNAFTAKEYTCYYMKVLDSHLELALDVLSDMLTASLFKPEDIERERKVILEEIHMYQDSPEDMVHDLHMENVWPNHPLGSNILGTLASVASLQPAMIIDYYRKFYTPDNLVIAAAGNLQHQELVALAEKYFGAMTGTKPKLAFDPPAWHVTQKVFNKDIEQVHLCLGTEGVPYDAPKTYPLFLLNNLLGGGISSRLFQSIREERGLAYTVYSYLSSYCDAGVMTIYAATSPKNAQEVLDLILANLRDIVKKGISSQELKKSQEQLKGNLMLGLESSSSRMTRLGKQELMLGRFETLDDVVRKIEAVTVDDLNNLARHILDENRFSLTVLGPLDKELIIR